MIWPALFSCQGIYFHIYYLYLCTYFKYMNKRPIDWKVSTTSQFINSTLVTNSQEASGTTIKCKQFPFNCFLRDFKWWYFDTEKSALKKYSQKVSCFIFRVAKKCTWKGSIFMFWRKKEVNTTFYTLLIERNRVLWCNKNNYLIFFRNDFVPVRWLPPILEFY